MVQIWVNTALDWGVVCIGVALAAVLGVRCLCFLGLTSEWGLVKLDTVCLL